MLLCINDLLLGSEKIKFNQVKQWNRKQMFPVGVSAPRWTATCFFALQGAEQQNGQKLQIPAKCFNETAHAGSMRQ